MKDTRSFHENSFVYGSNEVGALAPLLKFRYQHGFNDGVKHAAKKLRCKIVDNGMLEAVIDEESINELTTITPFELKAESVDEKIVKWGNIEWNRALDLAIQRVFHFSNTDFDRGYVELIRSNIKKLKR